MANFSNFYRNVRRNSRPQRKNTQATETLGNRIMRSSGVGASVNPLTPTQKAEQERAQRMRRGISPASYVVRSQVGRQITNAPRINKTVVTSNRLFGNLRGNALAPIKQTADYTRSQQSKYLNTDIQRKGMYTPATQLMAGKTNIGVEQGKTLRAGMMTNSPLIESWRPTSSAAEKVYRDRYGFNKEYQEALKRRLDNSSINEDVDARGTNRYDPHGDYAELSVPLPSGRAMPTAMTVQNGAGVYHVGDSLRDMKADDFRSGLVDTLSSKNPEDVYRRQTGKELDEDTLQRLEQQRGTWGYNAGMMTGQMAQYALTRGALSGLGIVGKAAQAEKAAKAAGNLNKARKISFLSELGIDQAASLPLNILDAFKENSPQEVSKRFLMNQGLDVLFSGVTTGISISNNPAFKEAKALHESANELRANGNKAMADATDMAAYKKMGEVPKEEIDLAQEEIRKGYHAGDGGKSEFYRNQAGGLRDTGAYGTGTYFGGSLDIFKGTGYESRPMNEIVNLDNYNLYRPQNAEQGVRVHDNLRRINRNVEKVADDVDTLNYGGIERINDAIERPFSKENLENIEDVAKRYLSKDEIDEIENKALNQFNRQHMSEEERAAERMALANDKEYVRDLKRTLQATGMDADDDIVIEAILDDLGFGTPEKTLDEIRYDWYSDALESSYRSGSRIPTKLEEASESVRAINELSQDLGISRDVVEDALRKTAETIRGYGGVDFNKKLDSASTVFMKNLGFEGVDVTGIKGLDNTRYGSVIYDLKPDDLRRISEGKPSEPIAEEPKQAVKEEPPKQEPEAEAEAEEPKATTEPKQEPKAEPKQEAESPKDGLGRDVFNGGERYHPSGESHTEKGWKAIERKYEKRSTAWLRKEKMKLPEKVSKGMDMEEAMERAKLIDSLIDEKERYRYGTVKEYNGEDVSRAFDTLSHSEKTELIHDAMRRSFVDDGIDNGIRGKIGRKVGMNPEEAVELAVSRVEKNADEVRARLSSAASDARGGEFPREYRNSQEYYAEVLAYLEHSTSKMEELIEKGLKDSDAYKTMEKDTTDIVSGAMALRSQEGYGAVQYNLLCRSNGEVRVAIVRKAVDDINEQFEKQLEKAAKKEGKELTDADKIRVVLTDDMVDRIKKVNPDSPLEMNRLLNDISREIWNQVPASGREVADSIRKTSMLLNFKTHERNFLGNAFMIPARMLKDAIGAPFEKKAISKGKMDITDASKARINRFSKEYKELKKGAEQIWAEWKDFVTGSAKYFDSAIPSASKLLGKRPIGGWGNKLLTAGIENPKMWRKVGDAVINFNGALLEWSDELFLKFHFVDSVVQSCKARGLDPSKLTSDELQSVIKTATGEAQRATFRDVSDAAKLINELKSVTPNDGRFKRGVSWVADTTLPFVNVPINVGRRAWDYSPFGLGEGIATIRKAWKTGDSKQVKKAIDKMASGATGTGIFVVGILLGRSGGATATLSDGKEGYYEQDQGHQEYSLNIEGENGIDIPFIELKNEDGISISLSPFAPWSIPLFMGVEAGSAMDGGKINWSGLLDVAGGALSPMLDMSVLQGPSDILNSIRKSENAPAMFVNLILTTMTNHYMQYVPTLMGQMARIQDPVRRDTTSYQENSVMKNLDKTKLKFISKIPSTPLTDNSLYNISSTRLNPYLDAWGREQKTYEDSKAKRAAYELFSPTYVRQKNITALDKEINRLNKLAANEDEVTVPTKFFDTALSLNGEKIQIDRNDIYEYNKVKGQEAYRKASKLIETDEYRNATTEEQRKMLNQVFTEANKEAKQQTLLKKGIDEYEVYTDGFTGGKLEQAENARAAGIKGKDYYTLVTDKSADADGNGTISQPEYYNYLIGKTQYTDAQKAVLWRAKNSGWKEETNPFVTGVPPKGTDGTLSTSNAQYTAEMKNSGLTEKQFAEVTSADTAKIDSNGSGRVSQAEYQAYLDGFSYLTNEQKSLLWKQYNPHWKKNPYDGSSTASSGRSKRGRSGRRSSGGSSSKTKKREKTASEKRFAALQTGKAPTNAKGIEALSNGAKGLTKAQKKALVKLMQKKLDV